MGAVRRHILVGVAGAAALILVYLVLIALAQDWAHALEQTAGLWYWVLALAGGFGVQAGLFSFIRQAMRERHASTTASVAASGGISSGSMAACCAHHLADVLPLLGLAGLAAFLVRYQLFFILVGVLSNIVGITVMLETIQRHGLWRRLSQWRGDMGRVKKVTIAAAVPVLAVAFAIIYLAP